MNLNKILSMITELNDHTHALDISLPGIFPAAELEIDADPDRIFESIDSLKERFLHTLARPRVLHSLDLSRNEMGPLHCVKLICQIIQNTKQLTSLKISDNMITTECMQLIAEAIKTNESIEELNIANNPLGYEGAVALAELIKENRTLKKIRLGGTRICRRGAQALAEALATNMTLIELDLSLDLLAQDEQVTELLLNGLRANTTLLSLKLGDTALTQDARISLSDFLSVNLKVQSLKVQASSIQDLFLILDICLKRPCFKKLTLGCDEPIPKELLTTLCLKSLGQSVALKVRDYLLDEEFQQLRKLIQSPLPESLLYFIEALKYLSKQEAVILPYVRAIHTLQMEDPILGIPLVKSDILELLCSEPDELLMTLHNRSKPPAKRVKSLIFHEVAGADFHKDHAPDPEA